MSIVRLAHPSIGATPRGCVPRYSRPIDAAAGGCMLVQLALCQAERVPAIACRDVARLLNYLCHPHGLDRRGRLTGMIRGNLYALRIQPDMVGLRRALVKLLLFEGREF